MFQRFWRTRHSIYLGLAIALMAWPISLWAISTPKYTTYQARIIKPNNRPLESSRVNFRFTILNPSANCILYVEDHVDINMEDSGGQISFSLGSSLSKSHVSSSTASAVTTNNTDLHQVFDNGVTSYSCGPNSTVGNYFPTADDDRKIVMQFQDGVTAWQTLPAMAINSVPYAYYAAKSGEAVSAIYANQAGSANTATTATTALNLNGKADTAFVETSTLAGLGCTISQALGYTGSGWGCINVASSTVITSATITTALGSQPLTASSTIALSGDVTGDTANTVVSQVGGKTAAAVGTSVDDTLAATHLATPSTLAKRDGSGNIQFNNISSNITSVNQFRLFNGSNSISFLSPVLAASYTLTFPASAGAVGQVLTTDGAGILSWSSPSTGSVITVSGTVNEVSVTGTASNPVIGLANNGVTSGTYTKVVVDSKGRVVSGTSLVASDVTTALGYTPAESGTITSSQWTTSGTNISYMNGNVGIGTSSPTAKLELASGSSSVSLLSNSTRGLSASNSAGEMQITSSGFDSGGGNIAGYRMIESTTGKIWQMQHKGLPQLNRLAFEYYNGSSWTTPFLIRDNGNVGIGTTVPTEKLQVSGGDIYVRSGSATNYSNHNGVKFSTDNDIYYSAILGNREATSGRIGISFLTSNVASAAEAMRVTYNGNVGIGTSAPAHRLDVAGDINVTGNFKVNGVNISTGTGTVTNVTGTGPISVTSGTTTPVVSIAQANSTTSGFLSSTDWNIFNNKLTTLDLGSVSATGTLSTARLPAFTGDVSSVSGSNLITLANSGVIANTYTKVTVDVKGRITSGTSLASSDVTTALGYTPANSATITSSQWTTSGTSISYMNGNVGIGTSNPTSVLQVAGDITPEADSSRSLGTAALRYGSAYIRQFYSGINTMTLNTTGAAIKIQPAGVMAMHLDPSGNVGIGTSVPASPLEVSGTVRLQQISFLPGYNTINGETQPIVLKRANGSHDSALVFVDSTNTMASRLVSVTGGGLGFHNGNGGVQWAKFDSLGNLGIGVVFPTAKLDVAGGANFGTPGVVNGDVTVAKSLTVNHGTSGIAELTVNSAAAAGSASLYLSNTGASGQSWQFLVGGNNVSGSGGSAVDEGNFQIRNVNDNLTRLFIAKSSGNVGIGTTTPAHKIDVAGDINVTGNFKVNGVNISTGTGTVTNVTGTGPISVTSGTTTPVVSIVQANSTTNGFLSSTDWNIFNNKLTTLDLGSTSATGTLAIARLPAMTGDVSSVSGSNVITLANSGVTSGAYTKITVDAKGRVVSGTSLLSSDVTSALGYTPANSATITSSQWTTSGGNIFYNLGNVGIGTTAPTANLFLTDTAGTAFDTIAAFQGFSGQTTSITGNSVITGSSQLYLNGMNFLDLQTVSASRMRITNTGNVGIGTISPDNKLTVAGGDFNVSASSGVPSVLIGTVNSIGNPLTPSGQGLQIAYDFSNQRADIVSVEGGLTYRDLRLVGKDITFRTGLSATAESFRITNTGNVGVGTVAPTEKLSVGGNLNLLNPGFGINRYINIAVNGGAEKSFIRFDQTAVTGPGNYWDIGSTGGNSTFDFGFEVSGTRHMTIANTGNVGIGISAPATTLDVSGTVKISGGSPGVGKVLTSDASGLASWATPASGTYSQWTTSGTNISYINGNVGVGTGNPTSKFEIAGSNIVTSTYNPGNLFVYSTDFQSADIGGSISLGGYNNAGSGLQTFATIEGRKTTSTAGGNSGYLSFKTSGASGTPMTTEKMRITESGNVGIGTTTPAGAIDVRGGLSAASVNSTSLNFYAQSSGGGNANGGHIILMPGVATGSGLQGNVGIGTTNPGSTLEVNSQNALPASISVKNSVSWAGILQTAGSLFQFQNGGTVRMTINATGNVGIGTTTPVANLDVQGQVRSVASGGAAQVNGSASVDWNNGNTQSMSVACTATSFTNMLDGGTYILAVSETGTTTCIFSHVGLTFYFSPANGARTIGKRTVYTFQRIGTDVYVSWIPGFQ